MAAVREGSVYHQDTTPDHSAVLLSLLLDVTLPSNLVSTSSSFETEPARFGRGEALRSPAPVEVHREMMQIYEKLQVSELQIQANRFSGSATQITTNTELYYTSQALEAHLSQGVPC